MILPFLRTNSGAASAGTAPLSSFPPPRFKPIVGPISDVRLKNNTYQTCVGETAAQRLGLRYEKLVQEWIQGLYPGYLAGAYIHFCDGFVQRTVQPDGILVFDNEVFIVEIKFQHMPEAWWQLDQLYKPLVQRLWSLKKVSLIEVCRSYDPSMPFPTEVTLFDDLRSWVSRAREEFGVLVWRK